MEPNPELYAKTKSRERNAWTLPSCFSTKKRPEIVKFDAAGAIGISKVFVYYLQKWFIGTDFSSKILDIYGN